MRNPSRLLPIPAVVSALTSSIRLRRGVLKSGGKEGIAGHRMVGFIVGVEEGCAVGSEVGVLVGDEGLNVGPSVGTLDAF